MPTSLHAHTRSLVSLFSLVCIFLLLQGCARTPLTNRNIAMRPTSTPQFSDDLQLEGLELGIRRTLESTKSSSDSSALTFGEKIIPISRYRTALTEILTLFDNNSSPSQIIQAIQEKFEFQEVYGDKEWGEALITSYFEPIIKGSLKPTNQYSQPLYKLPPEIVHLDLNDFDAKWSSERKLRGRIEGNKLLPYYSREEIDSKGALQGRGLEICWVDPIDAYFLHIQGSGTVVLPDGEELRLNFADKNGHPYRALGNFLTKAIPLKEMNLTNMDRYLRTLSSDELHHYLNMNPSYVFFTLSEKNAVTASGAPATPGRTIATDSRFFPKGALALLEFDKPTQEIKGNGEVTYPSVRVHRIVIDQDTGGAITGGGRVDLFWGRGKEAGNLAGRVKSRGRLWYLIPKIIEDKLP